MVVGLRSGLQGKGLVMNEHELRASTKSFAIRVMKLVDSIPNSRSGRVIAGQLARSGTSVAANYRAACRGRSKRDFVSKLGIVEEESDESALWMELLIEGGLMKPHRVRDLHDEAQQLTAIMASSRITASRAIRSIANRKSKIANP